MSAIKIRLYAMTLEELNTEEKYLKALESISPQRREKVERIKPEQGRKLSLLAGLLLEKALKDAGVHEIELEYRENRKPYLKGRDDIFFNLSHSGDMAICVVSPYEIGCDIEVIAQPRDKIAERYFTAQEKEYVAREQDGFFKMWTLKESFMKVTGKGLALNMQDFSINALEEEITVTQSVDDRSYSFIQIEDFEGYCCSVCIATANQGICIEKYY